MNKYPLNPFPKLIRAISRFTRDAAIVGFVERIEPLVITGWVIHRRKKPLLITLRIKGQEIQLEPIWVERADVAQQYGECFLSSGFRCEPPPLLAEAVRSALEASHPIEILANGNPLALTEDAAVGLVLHREPLAIKVRTDQFYIEVESWGYFVLQLTLVAGKESELVVGLLCNGMSLDCTVLPSVLATAAENGSDKGRKMALQLELPGYLWEHVGKAHEAKLQLQVDGRALEHEPIVLNREKAVSWIEDIARMGEGTEKQALSLLALEHLRYGDMLEQLNQKAARYFHNFAELMRLQDFLFMDKDAEAGTLSVSGDTLTESHSTLLLWHALRELNGRIRDRGQPVFEQVRSVINELKLRGGTRESFIFAVVPLLCLSGEFLRVRELIKFSRLQRLANSDNLWEMTLSIPAMIADEDITHAADVLHLAAGNLDSGWLNTECIHYAVLLLQRMEADGECEITVAEKFRYAVIALLDAFKGEWFSRLHDYKLVDSMILMLLDVDHYTDYHRRDVITAAQRIYGLNPTFWERANERGIPGMDTELALSHAHFRKLHQAFEAGCVANAEWLGEIAEALAYFRARHNPEAVIYLREVCANLLPAANRSLRKQVRALLSELLASDPAEAVRVAAFPLPEENRLLEAFSETGPGILRETLHSLSDSDKSVTWHMQENASTALKFMMDTEKDDKRKMVQALDTLEQRAITLANWQGGFLAFDLLASGYAYALGNDIETTSLISHMSGILKKAVEEADANGFLPAPILAGLNRLAAINPGNVYLHSFLTESRNLIRAKFDKRMDDLLVPVVQPQLRIAQSGWPHDTLVAIYSCRKYLDTRIKAIRETWIRDLKARGIPYVVVIGDGDDTITDDVLALDVSDKYEDLPGKSLKLFDWVYHNTDAQYVLKIDDDCYLDVARFFDTLSYRKHHYYGRVLRRGIGSTDRTWHQPKSSTPHARKLLDRSPEPSVYADGGGGYTLSRLGMHQLLQAEKTHQGERLKACSFMEDKLVGDLLALHHIEPSNEDYDAYQRRRTFGEAMPVGMWENSFFPCKATPTKMVHLDSELDMTPTHARASSRELWPKKIWPTCWTPAIKKNKNQLELLSDSVAAKKLLEQKLQLISVVRNEITMLPHFLAHYRALGVKSFVFADNCSDDGTREYLLTQPDVILYSADTEYKYSHYGVAWQQAVLGNLCLGKWVLLADADEFLVFEGSESNDLERIVTEIEAEGKDAICTLMVDMYPAGELTEADFSKRKPFDVAYWFDNPMVIPWRLGSGWFSNSASYTSHLRHRVVPNAVPHDFVSQKYALFRYNPWVRLSQGVHYASNLKVSGRPSWFAHFKYHAGLQKKVATEIRRGQHFNNAAEYRRYAAMLAEGHGGFRKEGVSAKYEGSQSFSRLVAQENPVNER